MPPSPPFSPSLISLMVSVDVKHHVYLSRTGVRRDKFFVATQKFCRDKHAFVATSILLSRQKTYLSQQIRVCRDKSNYVCRDKSMLVATNTTSILLSRQNFRRDKQTFVATNTRLSQRKRYLAEASILFSRQKTFTRRK